MSLLKNDFTREQRFLLAKQSLFTKQTQMDLASKKLRFMDADVMHACDITEAGGIFDLLRTTNDKQVGLSDFDSNRLDNGQNVCVGRLRFAIAKAPKSDGKTADKVVYSTDFKDFPAELLNAKLMIKQDSKILCSLPVERFTTKAGSTKVQGEEDVLHLGTPIILVEQKPISVQLEFNPTSGINAGTDNVFVQVRFIGTQTSSK